MAVYEFLRYLFPYRTYLENQIEELKSRLAQANRRLDEYREREQESPTVTVAPQVPKQDYSYQPIGWDAYRAFHRDDDKEN